MKKTQEALTAKMVLGQIFLLLAALVVVSMFVDIPFLNKGLYQIDPENNGNNIGESLSGILKFMLAGTLLFHYAYAGLYYPLKYKRYFQLMNRGIYTEEFPVFDLSTFRGIVPMAVIALLFFTNISLPSFFTHVILAIVCRLLGYLTATNRMFNKSSTEVNSLAIMMALQGQDKINIEEYNKTVFNSLSFRRLSISSFFEQLTKTSKGSSKLILANFLLAIETFQVVLTIIFNLSSKLNIWTKFFKKET